MVENDTEALKSRNKALKRILQDELKPAKIVRLKSVSALDHDGDPIIRIRVVYEADNNRLDPNKTLALSRILSNKLRETFAKTYPVFYFLTKEEDTLASS